MTPQEILHASKCILLVDWPGTYLPRALLAAGFTVYGYSPGQYTEAAVVDELPEDIAGLSIFPPKAGDEKGYLVFRKLPAPPAHADIVHIYRPEAEHAAIFATHGLPLGAHAVWLQPPVTSVTARELAEENGLEFVEGVEITEMF